MKKGVGMEIALSIAFGLWISITALVYRAVTSEKHRGRHDR